MNQKVRTNYLKHSEGDSWAKQVFFSNQSQSTWVLYLTNTLLFGYINRTSRVQLQKSFAFTLIE